MNRNQLILQAISLLTKLGIKPSNFIGKGTNVIKFPKLDEITPFKPNLLEAMRTGGENSMKLAKKKFEDNANYLVNSNDMELQNFINNVKQYLNITEPRSAGIVATGEKAPLIDIKTGSPVTQAVEEVITKRYGLPKNVDPESPVGGILQSTRNLRSMMDDIQGISPQQRIQMDQEAVNRIIQEIKDAGGTTEDAYRMLQENPVNDVDVFERIFLPRYKEAFKIGPKSPEEIELAKDAADTVELYGSNSPQELADHLQDFYNDSQMKYNIETTLEKIIKNKKGISEEDVYDFLSEAAPERGRPIEEHMEILERAIKDKYNLDINKDFYINYYNKYKFQNKEQIKNLMESVTDKPENYQDFAEGGRVSFKGGASVAWMIEALVKLRDVPRKMLEYVSKRKNGFKQIQKLYEDAFGEGPEGVMSVANEKLGSNVVKTADDIERPEKSKLREMYEEFNKRQEERETIMRQDAEARAKDPEAAKEFDEMWENPESFPRRNRQLTDEEIEEYEEILGDSETWMNEGTVEEAEAAVKRRKEYEDQMYSEYKVEKQGRKELEEAYKEIDFRMTGEDTKYEANELADMLAEIRYKTEYSDLPQNTQIDLYDEAYNYLMEVKRDAANFKGATNIKTGKNIVTGEQELPLDPMTGKPRKLNAEGGLIDGIGTMFEEK